MPTPIQITTPEENTNVQIRPISNIYEFENGVFLDQSNFYFDDKTDRANPFLASIEIKDESGEIHWINYKIANAANIQRKSVSDNKIIYTIDDYEIEYIVSEGQLKENIILNNPINQREFKFTLKLSQWLEYRIENNEVIFFDIRNDQALLKIPAPSMTDAVGRTSNQIEYVFGMEGEYKTLSVVVVDEEFLTNAIYPVVIDPTTVNIVTGTMYSNGGNQQIVRDSLGNIYIVYLPNISSTFNVFVRKIATDNTMYYITSSGWATSGTELTINSVPGSSLTYPCSNPVIAIDSSNRLYIVWNQKTSSVAFTKVYFAQINNLDTPNVITYTGDISTSIGNYNQLAPSLNIDQFDNLHLVWSGNDSANQTNQQIKYIKGTNNNGSIAWGSWSNIKVSSSLVHSNLRSGVDSQNNLHIVTRQGSALVYLKGTNNAGIFSWSSYTTIDTQGIYCDVAIDSNDIVHVGYISSSLPKYTNSQNWEGNKKTGFESSGTSSSPKITVDSVNHLYFCWCKDSSAFRKATSSDFGLNWEISDVATVTNSIQSLRWSKFNNNFPDKIDSFYSTNGLTYQDLSPADSIAPTGFAIINTTYKSFDCSWTDASNDELGFKIYKASTSTPNPSVDTLLKTVVSSPTTITEADGLIPNTNNYYYVLSYNAKKPNSAQSASNVVQQSTVISPPALVSNVLSSSRIQWSFDQYSDIVEYYLYDNLDTRIGRIVYEGGVWKAYWGTAPEVLQNTYSTPQIEQSKTDTSITLNPGTAMTLKVTSKYGSYESPTKASASATTNALPATPTGFTGVINGLNNLRWTISR